ncbi:MAG TPA: TolC family protein [Gammaproteobacteria bacterium]|nr:TolC family protein [Gammaproteobacteria bacterium]MBT6651134.1 TolC family protein [Gammaproteobacteria bacterium]MBT7329349.1 TolC family protein [Gammaproteobacteria bacterium]HIJ21937.1 TolC family protein [Gammaproteobacteria bacterium]
MRWCFILLSALLSSSLVQAGAIPEPLSLQQALQFATPDHPRLAIFQSRLAQSQFEVNQVESRQGVTLDLQARIRSKALQQQVGESVDDHLFSVIAGKPLYDFGRSGLEHEIAVLTVDQRQAGQEQALQQLKLEIMQRFFDVLLADHQRTVADEAMTIAYLRFQKKQDKAHTGAYSELDLLQAESLFQDERAIQKRREMEQRMSRIRLAELMNHPTEIPSTLIAPMINPSKLVEMLAPVDSLKQTAWSGNGQIAIRQQQINAAQKEVERAQLAGYPQLDASMEWLDHSRVTSSKDRWRASLLLEIPLFDSGSRDYQLAAAREVLHQAQSALEVEKRTIATEIDQLYLQLISLEAQWGADQLAEEYRDFELDRNRALYEQEQQSNFGDALVGVSSAHLRSAKSRFEAMLIYTKLEYLIGKEVTLNE